MERFLDDLADSWKTVLCVGAGNEGDAAGHTEGIIGEENEEVLFRVSALECAFSIQLWKSFVDEMEISIQGPTGEERFLHGIGTEQFQMGDTELLVYYGEPKPYSVKQEIYFSFEPKGQYVDEGIWKLRFYPRKIVNGHYQLWLPAQSSLNVGTAFLRPYSMNTLTIPGMATRAVTVAAYDAKRWAYAEFSGRGSWDPGECEAMLKPDVAAPGVDVTAPAAGGGYGTFSGTSFSTPFVTGDSALLMEWGIVRGKDPYLYGEKVKAYLRKAANELPGYEQWPNPLMGYGVLNERQSS